LIDNDKKILKKRTSIKKADQGISINEAMIFSMPPAKLTTVQLRFTIYGIQQINGEKKIQPIGHIIIGSCSTGKGLRHWHQMLSSLRKPVAMWHALRKAANQPTFSGEVVAKAMKNSLLLHSKRKSIY